MKMESELENVQLEVKGALYELNIKQLLTICNGLQISGLRKEQLADKTRGQLITLVIEHIEKIELAELEDEGLSHLLSIKDLIENAKLTELVPVGEAQERDDLQKEVDALRTTLQAKEEAIHQLMSEKLSLQSTPLLKKASAPPDCSIWRKDFKISGQIGEPGQKDKLTFSSLTRQIESGLNKGYHEDEIVDAVIRAITPGLQLRSYLEGKGDLTLPALRRILRSHYQERGATELYKQLSSEVQSSKETPQNFLLRTMDLRQKILFASQEADSGLKYDPALVQSLFMHTILTGLQSDNVKSDMQPYLLQSSTSDEVLLEKVNIACANERERQDKKKHAVPHRAAIVNAVHHSDTPAPVGQKTVQKQITAAIPPDLLSEIKEMRSEMVLLKDLRAEVSQIRETIQKSTSTTPPTSGGPEHRYFTPTFTPHPPYQEDPSSQHCSPQRPQAALQPYYPAAGSASTRGIAQFQQRFAPQRYYMPRPQLRCYGCIQTGEEFCQHCFRCGSSEHFRAGCKAQRPVRPARGNPLN